MKFKFNAFAFLILIFPLIFLLNISAKAFFIDQNNKCLTTLTESEESSSQSSSSSSTPSSAPEPSSSSVYSSQAKSEPTKNETASVYSRTYSSALSHKKIIPSEVPSMESDESSEMSLPEVSFVETSVADILDLDMGSTTNNNFIFGLIAWICIGLGILVIIIVIFSSTPLKNLSVSGKHYSKPKKTRKHLLADKYYRDIKK